MVEDLQPVDGLVCVDPLDPDKRIAVVTEGLKQITGLIGNGCRVSALSDIKNLKPWELSIPAQRGIQYKSTCVVDSHWVRVTFDCVNTRVCDPQFRTGTMIEVGFDGLELLTRILFTETYKNGSVPIISSNTTIAARRTFQLLRRYQIPPTS